MSIRNSSDTGADAGRSLRRLILFVADGEPNSLVARENLQKICDAEPNCRFDVQLVNVFEDYRLALEYRVLVTPCLVMHEPLPRVMVVGTLNDMEKVRAALRLKME